MPRLLTDGNQVQLFVSLGIDGDEVSGLLRLSLRGRGLLSRTPLLERVKFLAIVSSNLDEFFMKRIGGLKQQVGAGLQEPTVDGRTPEAQIVESIELVGRLEERRRAVLAKLSDELKKHDIVLATWDELSADDQAYVREYYFENIFPLVTPQATDPAHPSSRPRPRTTRSGHRRPRISSAARRTATVRPWSGSAGATFRC